jgi:UTP--glucose-1-phosphate uridylyltransferase
METKTIRKAVIAAAGFGTRFLPQTKAMPKEMLPLVDKPIIQYVVEELVSVGIEDIVIVTGYSKRALEDHFDRPSADLIANLKMGGPKKEPLLRQVESIADLANFIYVRQKGPYGTGTPLLNAEHLIGDEPFIFTWSDDFIVSDPPRFQQLIDVYKEHNSPVMAGIRAVSDRDYDRYGFAGGKPVSDGVIEATTIVEKPGKQNAPSDLATVSGYLLTPDIFPYLHAAAAQLDAGHELHYNDALKLMLRDGKKVMVREIQKSRYYDAGNKLEYLKTVVDFALRDAEIKDDFGDYLRKVLG